MEGVPADAESVGVGVTVTKTVGVVTTRVTVDSASVGAIKVLVSPVDSSVDGLRVTYTVVVSTLTLAVDGSAVELPVARTVVLSEELSTSEEVLTVAVVPFTGVVLAVVAASVTGVVLILAVVEVTGVAASVVFCAVVVVNGVVLGDVNGNAVVMSVVPFCAVAVVSSVVLGDAVVDAVLVLVVPATVVEADDAKVVGRTAAPLSGCGAGPRLPRLRVREKVGVGVPRAGVVDKGDVVVTAAVVGVVEEASSVEATALSEGWMGNSKKTSVVGGAFAGAADVDAPESSRFGS